MSIVCIKLYINFQAQTHGQHSSWTVSSVMVWGWL